MPAHFARRGRANKFLKLVRSQINVSSDLSGRVRFIKQVQRGAQVLKRGIERIDAIVHCELPAKERAVGSADKPLFARIYPERQAA